MLNIEQFTYLVVRSLAISLAKPGNRGPNFTWIGSFQKCALSHVKFQWYMANRSERVIERSIRSGKVQRIIDDIANDFAEITGAP